MSSFDLVISNATVIDGSVDATPQSHDVGIAGGLITDVGDLSGRDRVSTYDAGGLVLSPGFIDTHTHIEQASLWGRPDKSAAISQGVTTTLVGADGFGWVGLGTDDAPRWWEDTAAIYGHMPQTLPDWASPAAFLRQLRQASLTDVVPLVPHNNVRAAVMGSDPKPAGRTEMSAMHGIVSEWLDEGAVGLATGLDYLPGRFASTDEIVELCEPVVERGGVYASHVRLLDGGRDAAWREAAEIGARSGAGVRIAHERLDAEGLALLNETSNTAEVMIDSYLYPAGCTSLAFHVPPELLEDGVMSLASRLQVDDATATALAAHLDERLEPQPGREIIIAGTTSGRHEGATLGQLAEAKGVGIGSLAVELLREEMPCSVLIYMWQAAGAEWDDVVRRTLADERTHIASDGVYNGSSPHPRGFGAFPRVLGKFARDNGWISLSNAVHKLSAKPAEAYGLADRGRVAVGLRADLVVFDPETVNGTEDYADARRSPTGIDLVLVAGKKTGGN